MQDIFDREQRIFDEASAYLAEHQIRGSCEIQAYAHLVKEYGRLLRQTRRVTRISDKTAVNLNTSRLDLMDKVHLDSLTGIYNRRFMEEQLGRIFGAMRQAGTGCVSLMMMDIDFFKRYNDTYGHTAGDECLRTVAQALQGCILRTDDFVARYGGEEFTAVLQNTDRDGAAIIAQRILEAVRECRIPHEKNEACPYVTLSIGVSTAKVGLSTNSGAILKRADEALYLSKTNGRNQFTYLSYEEEDAP